MASVLFGQGYYLRFDPKLWEAMQPFPPLGTLYAAAYLRQQGYDVALFDAMLAASEQDWVAALQRHRPRYAVLYEDNFNYLSKMCLLRMREASFVMLEAARAAGATVIVCGSDATDHLKDYFDRGARFALVGEGELTLAELLDHLEGRRRGPLEAIRGLAYRNEAGQLVRTPAREFIRQLDELPFPAWDLVDVERYRRIWLDRHGYYAVNMVTTRGCPYSCNWCAKPIYGRRYNARSPEHVAAELAWLKTTVRPDYVWFADDIFGLKPGWIERYAEAVVRLGIHTPFKCLLRVDLVTDSVADALRRAGCDIVWMGAESGSQKILDAMDKGTLVEQIGAATRMLQARGIRVGYFLQFGYPGESWEDVQATLRMVRQNRPDDIGISVAYPLPGTVFYDNVRSQLGERRNWRHSDDLAMLYRGPYPEPFYRALHRAVHGEHRVRRVRARLATALRSPHTLRPGHLRDVARVLRDGAALAFYRARLAWLARHPSPDAIQPLPVAPTSPP